MWIINTALAAGSTVNTVFRGVAFRSAEDLNTQQILWKFGEEIKKSTKGMTERRLLFLNWL